MLEDILLLYLPKLIAIIVFVYSLFKFFKKKSSFYSRQFICAVGVYLFAEIYSDVIKVLGLTLSTDFSIKYIGLLASFLFILSAETGVLDNLIDDGGDNLKKYRRIGYFGPIVLLAMIISIIIVVLLKSTRSKPLLISLLVVTYAPAVVGIYYVFKHTIMPTNGIPFLKKTKVIESIIFFAYIFSPSYYLFLTLGYIIVAKIITIVVLFLFCAALFLSTKEAKYYE